MELIVLGSSSKGNCYILDDGKEALIVEAGIPLKSVKEALGFNIRKVVGCCVTHQHNDHAGHIKNYVPLFRTIALPEVWKAKGVSHRHAYGVKSGQAYKLGNFTLMPFDVEHDVPCVGYLIHHPSMGLLMFATDTCSLDIKVPGMCHVLIECNYSVTALRRAIEEHRTDESQVARLAKSHMEFATTKAFLQRNDLSNVSEVVLIHLSANNSDSDRFVSEIQSLTGKPTYAAHAGMKIELPRI